VAGLDVDAGLVQASFYRHIPHGADPLYRPPDPADGRWQHGTVIEGWYLADTPETAWAEWYRALAELAIPPERMLPRDLWRWVVELEQVALLNTPARLERVGLPVPQPTSSQWSRYQYVGDTLYRAGYRALLVVSAARPANRNLVVFRESLEVDSCTPIPPPTVTASAPIVPRGMRT
jgi:RES domain-containing protein